MNRGRWSLIAIATLVVAAGMRVSPNAQAQVSSPAAPTARVITVAPANDLAVRDMSIQIDRMVRDGDLQVREVREDTLISGRVHEHLDQYYGGRSEERRVGKE